MENKIKLIFADDCRLQQKIIELLLTQLDLFDLQFMADNGSELLRYLGSCKVLPQICILDLHMPVMNGIDTVREMRRRFPSIKVFGYTATDSLIEISDFRRNGVLQVFSKRNPKQMLEVICSYGKMGARYESPLVVRKNSSIISYDNS
ncbi:response regulator [Sphingobacterium detergens]|uniref:Response regulator receiver domain-containing protein n=1 Tax=Sphingobacterium detergens TaxID=1145106 RepID=A0A420ALJ2_SPHD1|nr:response regulator [Sphingobacterium detergens]RKE45334.1 response regulator receiver domain-containing protein [Sphingobacterium detergens]